MFKINIVKRVDNYPKMMASSINKTKVFKNLLQRY